MHNCKELERMALENREHIIDMIYDAQAGHPGGSLSMIDMLTALYDKEMDFTSKKRTKVVLSKGHAVPAQYAVLKSYGILSDEDMKTFRRVDSKLQGHPYDVTIPEVDATTGLLGQGLSIGLGMALAKKYLGDPHSVYVFTGDGEMQEGQIWESIMQAGHYQVDNLCLIIDSNKLASSGLVHDAIRIDSIEEKLKAFHFHTITIDGNHMKEVVSALYETDTISNRPVAIIMNTIKGKGISFMEDNPKWHSGALSADEYQVAKQELANAKEAVFHDL